MTSYTFEQIYQTYLLFMHIIYNQNRIFILLSNDKRAKLIRPHSQCKHVIQKNFFLYIIYADQ